MDFLSEFNKAKYIEDNKLCDIDFNEYSIIKKNMFIGNNIQDKTILENIQIHFNNILERIENKDVEIYELFMDYRFVRTFTRYIINNKIKLDNDRLIICNSLCYDYIKHSGDKGKLYDLYISLGQFLNNQYINKIIGRMNISRNDAVELVIARTSSVEEETCIKRLNHAIISLDIQLSEQNIVDIYQVLFSKMYVLFKTTMFDIYTEDHLKMISDHASEVNSTVSLAVLDLLHHMPINLIQEVLRLYSMEYNLYKCQVRFSIWSIATRDYFRILQACENLKSNHIIVP